ncbi:MAG TPA: autotransporter outer membrane beta-barrel domain-containing protein [Steroidobacteraceae bacterium]
MISGKSFRVAAVLALLGLMAPELLRAQVKGPPRGATLAAAWTQAMAGVVNSTLCTNFLQQGGGVTPAQGAACLTAAGFAGTANAVAIRSAAPEELTAANVLLKELAHRQLDQLNQRLERWHAADHSGQFAALPRLASLNPQEAVDQSGGLSQDFGRWGVFTNLAGDFGSRSATDLTDSFDLRGFNLTTGADYRLSRGWVIGGIAGYTDERAVFDAAPGTGGRLEHSGFSLLAYGQYEGQSAYVTGSLGWQQLDQRLERSGTYVDPAHLDAGGNNLSAKMAATGSTNIGALFATLQSGYSWSAGPSTVEPYLQLQYRRSKLDPFTESGGAGVVSDGTNSYPFDINMSYAGAHVTSLDGTIGLKWQRVVNGAIGVYVPYLNAEYTHQFNDTPYTVSGMLAPLSGIVPDFTLPADALSGKYYSVIAGCNYVARGGLQAYLQIRSSFKQTNLKDRSLTAGLRHEL